MIYNFLGRSAWALFCAVLLGAGVYCNDDLERGENLENNQPRFTPDISP